MQLLSDKRIIVTGGSSGIGAATCSLLAAHGATVFTMDRSEAGADPAFHAVVDIADSAQVAHAFAQATEQLGHIDSVVHAAGVDDAQTKALVAAQTAAGEPVDSVTGMSDEQWHRMISINLDGAFYVLREAIRALRHQGTGSVVLVGSETGVRGLAGLPHYSASKGGVHALVRSVAKEAAAYGVRVNGIAPGVIDTPMSRRSGGVFGGAATTLAPLGRLGMPEEVAGVAVFLCSDLASYVVGEVVNVDGGRMAS